jgi:hypothetical protein
MIVLEGLSKMGYVSNPISGKLLKLRSDYHLNLVSDMAWLASNTHIVTLVVLQRYFQKHLGLRVVRIAMMLLLAARLIAMFIFTAHQYDYVHFSFPAECLIGELSSNIGGIPMRWMIVSIIFICTNYPIASIVHDSWVHPIVYLSHKPFYSGLSHSIYNQRRYPNVPNNL